VQYQAEMLVQALRKAEFQAQELTANNGLVLNATTINTSFTIAAGYNAMSVGPITTASGVTVTVTPGQRWVVL
jgi:hypothetical protein